MLKTKIEGTVLPSPNTRGRALLNCITNNNLSTLAPPDSTYWHSQNNRLPHILDLFVYKLPSNIHSTIRNFYDLSSDHTLTLLEIGLSPSIPKTETLTPGHVRIIIQIKIIIN